jgi:hypothetical protein
MDSTSDQETGGKQAGREVRVSLDAAIAYEIPGLDYAEAKAWYDSIEKLPMLTVGGYRGVIVAGRMVHLILLGADHKTPVAVMQIAPEDIRRFAVSLDVLKDQLSQE